MSISRLALSSSRSVAWDIGLSSYRPNRDSAWDISTAVQTKTFATPSDNPNITGVTFKPDGTKMYTVYSNGSSLSNGLFEYNLITPWDVGTASFVQSIPHNDIGNPFVVSFKPDGTKMYGASGGSTEEYDLSTPWDISTAVLNQTFSGGGLAFFRADGLKAYSTDVEYDLSTPWDVSTAVANQSFDLSAQDSQQRYPFFREDGAKMYISGGQFDQVYEYDLTTPWDTSTLVFVQSFSTFLLDPWGLYVRAGYMFVADAGGLSVDFVRAYTLGGFSVNAQEGAPRGLFFKPDGLKMYVIGNAGDDVNEYDLSTPWNIPTSVYSQNFSVAAQDIEPRGIFFKPDGLKMYVIGLNGVDVNEYNLSTPWDISTSVYSQNFSVGPQETNPHGLFFKPDGLKMYVIGTSGDDVNEYSLSTPWDISTASYLQNFSVAAQEGAPRGLFFKPDGLKMYVIGTSGDAVSEYDLSTPWDVSTAAYSQNFSVAAQDTFPAEVFFRPDGKAFYVIGLSRIYQYKIG